MVKTEEMLKNLEELINTPSVVGFYPEIHKKLAEMVGKFGYELEFDNKRTAYVRVPGKDSSKIVCVGAHLDTIGMQVRHVMDNGWIDEYPDDSAPYTSTIVFLVRKGNPKNIHDWDDLTKDGVGVITPNPKTSGGARWNYMAAWAYANEKYNGNEIEMKAFIKKLYKNVLVLDSGARGATTSFVENGQGDVLIAWENEAFLSVRDNPDDYEIVTPSISILAQPSVAVVDENVKKHDNAEAAKAYLKYLYSDEAQKLEAQWYYRPSNEKILKEYSYKGSGNTIDKLPKDNKWIITDVDLTNIGYFGGWSEATKKHFSDGGVFDSIYEEK